MHVLSTGYVRNKTSATNCILLYIQYMYTICSVGQLLRWYVTTGGKTVSYVLNNVSQIITSFIINIDMDDKINIDMDDKINIDMDDKIITQRNAEKNDDQMQ